MILLTKIKYVEVKDKYSKSEEIKPIEKLLDVGFR
jgi:hypothetical protein